ncbi:MAG: hypothetical protein EBR10_10560 [Planctomycetes bacterium]|nr:hypothetical protein [Planctomycetota bacterium]
MPVLECDSELTVLHAFNIKLEEAVVLSAAEADYVVVGGIALAHHGVVRYTNDIDVLIQTTPDNARRVRNALQAFGFGSVQLTAADLCVPDRVVQLGFPPSRIDILP